MGCPQPLVTRACDLPAPLYARHVSYRILVTDDIDADGVALLTAEPSFIVDEVPTLPPAELLERIGNYDAFVGRSATRITEELLKRATKLRVVGRAGVCRDNCVVLAAGAHARERGDVSDEYGSRALPAGHHENEAGEK